MFPGNAFGTRNQPAYVASVPTPRDFMSREVTNVGNTAMSSPFGFSMGNPFMNMLMQGVVLPSVAGSVGIDYKNLVRNLAPVIPPNMGFNDWMDSRRRFDTFQQPAMRAAVLDNAYSWESLGTFNTLAQDVFDANFNPAGSAMQTAQTIYGRFGSMFSGDPNQQLSQSLAMYKNLNSTFNSKNSAGQEFFDFNKSFGFNRPQIADMLDTAARRGIGGLSSENIGDLASNPETFKEKASSIAKFMSSAQDIFGRDKGFDELTQLIGKTLANFQTVDPQRATDLLQKIQATSRALNISADAMSEYVGLFNDLDRSMGGAGVGNTMQALRGAEMGSTVAAVQRAQGGTLTDTNEAMVAMAQMGAGATNSYRGKWSMGFFSSFARLSDSERSMQGKDGRTMNEMMEDYKRAWNSGDQNAMVAAQQRIEKSLAGSSVLSAEDIRAGAAHLTRGDRAVAEQFMSENGMTSAAEALQIGGYRKSISGSIADRFSKDNKKALFEKAGGMAGLTKIMASMGEEEAKDRSKAAEKIYQAAGGKLTRAEAQEYARSFSTQVEQEHREAYKKGKIFSDAGDGEAAFSAVWALGSDKAKESGIAKRTMDAEIATILGENVKGSIMKGIGISDVIGAIPKHWEPVRQKVIEAARVEGRDISKGDWTMKDWMGFMKEGVNAGLTDISKADQIQQVREDIEKTQAKIQQQYDKDIKAGYSPEVAKKRAMDTAKAAQAEIAARVRDNTGLTKGPPTSPSPEDNAALEAAGLANSAKLLGRVADPDAKPAGDGKAGPPVTGETVASITKSLDRIAKNTDILGEILKPNKGREQLMAGQAIASDGFFS